MTICPGVVHGVAVGVAVEVAVASGVVVSVASGKAKTCPIIRAMAVGIGALPLGSSLSTSASCVTVGCMIAGIVGAGGKTARFDWDGSGWGKLQLDRTNNRKAARPIGGLLLATFITLIGSILAVYYQGNSLGESAIKRAYAPRHPSGLRVIDLI